MLKHVPDRRRPGMPDAALPLAPTSTGPEALRDWAGRHIGAFRLAYREAVRAGWAASTLVVATPATESLDDPPAGFALRGPADARRLLGAVLPSPRLAVGVAPPGMFYVIATGNCGRFQGTFVGLLPSPGPDEPLPAMAALPPPCCPGWD
jgi:hypothetical protein